MLREQAAAEESPERGDGTGLLPLRTVVHLVDFVDENLPFIACRVVINDCLMPSYR